MEGQLPTVIRLFSLSPDSEEHPDSSKRYTSEEEQRKVCTHVHCPDGGKPTQNAYTHTYICLCAYMYSLKVRVTVKNLC